MIQVRFSTRLVILAGNSAIKIPLGYRGFLQAYNEKKLWQKYRNCGLLNQFRWIFLGIVCCKRIEPLEELDPGIVRQIKARIPELNIRRCDLYKKENWGKDQGRVLLLDYGISEYISSLYPV
jgi:hypothetical protein